MYCGLRMMGGGEFCNLFESSYQRGFLNIYIDTYEDNFAQNNKVLVKLQRRSHLR